MPLLKRNVKLAQDIEISNNKHSTNQTSTVILEFDDTEQNIFAQVN